MAYTAGTIGSSVTGGAGLSGSTSLGTVTTGDVSAISTMVYMGKTSASTQLHCEFVHGAAATGGTPDFSSTYCAHLFIIENYKPVDDSGQMRCTYSTTGGGALASDYVSSNYDAVSHHGDSDIATTLTSTDSYRMGAGVLNSGEGWSGQLWLYGASNVKAHFVYFNGMWQHDSSGFYFIRGFGRSRGPTNTPEDIDALRFHFHAGNVTSGTVRMYGMKA